MGTSCISRKGVILESWGGGGGGGINHDPLTNCVYISYVYSESKPEDVLRKKNSNVLE